jgi:hypothetical protein
MRVRAGSWIYMRINVDELTADEINAGQYLAFKEQLVEGERGEVTGYWHAAWVLCCVVAVSCIALTASVDVASGHTRCVLVQVLCYASSSTS